VGISDLQNEWTSSFSSEALIPRHPVSRCCAPHHHLREVINVLSWRDRPMASSLLYRTHLQSRLYCLWSALMFDSSCYTLIAVISNGKATSMPCDAAQLLRNGEVCLECVSDVLHLPISSLENR
jgi:hypothetical protein